MDFLEHFFNSKSRAAIISILFAEGHSKSYLRQIERESGLSIGTIQNEVKKLAELNLIKSERDGNRLYFSANFSHPISYLLKELVGKTVGIVPRLKEVLSKLDINISFIYGSFANGNFTATSDLDIMIIGNTGLRKLSSQLAPLSEEFNREISPYRMSVEEFKRKLRAKNHFISGVMKKEKEFLIGDEDELRKIS